MIKFNKPANLNGTELLDELESVGVILDRNTQLPLVDGNGDLWLAIKSTDKSKVQAVVDAHNGNVAPKEPTIAEKLASVGLTIDDLKVALGLNA